MQRSGFPLPHSLQFRNMDEIFSSLHSLAFPTFPRTVQIYYRFANLDSDRFFVTCRKHRFIELANLQISKNFDLSKSNNREKVIEPSIANHEKNIGCPPLAVIFIKILNSPSINSGTGLGLNFYQVFCFSLFYFFDTVKFSVVNCYKNTVKSIDRYSRKVIKPHQPYALKCRKEIQSLKLWFKEI